ncbi:hypothetical protein [Brunnivagina elsteri]|nr:hypothetical protein [Calothrix elsteri]
MGINNGHAATYKTSNQPIFPQNHSHSSGITRSHSVVQVVTIITIKFFP